MPIPAIIETILKGLNVSEDPVSILKKLLNDILPKQQSVSYVAKQAVSPESEEIFLVRKMLEILNKTGSLTQTFILLNYRYLKIGQKKQLVTQKKQLDRSNSLLEQANTMLAKKNDDSRYLTYPPKRKVESIGDFNKINEVIIAFLSVFDEYHSLIKSEVRDLLEKQYQYQNLWKDLVVRYTGALLPQITGESNAVKRCELINMLSVFSRWMPDEVQSEIGEFLLQEMISTGGNGDKARVVILELRNRLSKEIVEKALVHLFNTFRGFFNTPYRDRIIALCDSVFSFGRQMIKEEDMQNFQTKADLLVDDLVVSMDLDKSSVDAIQTVSAQLSGFFTFSHLQKIIAKLRHNLKNTNDEFGSSAMRALTQLLPQLRKFEKNESTAELASTEMSLIMEDIVSCVEQHSNKLMQCIAHEELMKFKKYVPNFNSEKYFKELFELMNKVESGIELRKSCMRGIIHLADAENLLELVNALMQLLKNDESIEIKSECIKTFAGLRPHLVHPRNVTQQNKMLELIIQLVDLSVLAPQAYFALIELKNITPIKLEEEVCQILLAKLFNDQQEINEVVLDALLQYKDKKLEEECNQVADIILSNKHDDSKELMCGNLLKLIQIFSVSKRHEIAAYLMKQLQLCEKDRTRINTNKSISSLECLYLKTLAAYAFDVPPSMHILMMNYLRTYIADNNTGHTDAQVLYLKIYMSYRHHCINHLVGNMGLFSFVRDTKTNKMGKVIQNNCIEKILSYSP